MYISKIKLHNFRSFGGNHTVEFQPGVNYLVGNNNSGKTTIFRAIDFLCNGGARDDVITKDCLEDNNEFVAVEVELSGDSMREAFAADKNLKKYAGCVVKENGLETIRLKRSSLEAEITQAGKKKIANIKNILIYNAESQQFENIAGIDKTISTLFDVQFVWADMSSTDVADFSKTKVCGRILSAILSNSPPESWHEFKEVHNKIFKGVEQKLKPIEDKISQRMLEQYGPSNVKFNFALPEVADFLKNGSITMLDNGCVTDSAEKGTGMQRALALSLIQVYADMRKSDNDKKPILFFLDEPETFLHPMAQDKLLSSMGNLSKSSQVFIATHSPYLLRNYNKTSDSLYVFSRSAEGVVYEPDSSLGVFSESSPTIPEINYFAFRIPSAEFHNELYGFIQARAIERDDSNEREKKFDKFLCNLGATKNKQWVRLKGGEQQHPCCVTLQTYIRNLIHHPENTYNDMYSDDELRKSIDDMVEWLHELSVSNGGNTSDECGQS